MTRNLYYDTVKPYKELPHDGIQYTTCRNYNHISRYKGLRQIVHAPSSLSRFISLETPNAISSESEFLYYDVPHAEENRIDLIANRFFGSAQYGWIISYFNGIEDGFTVLEGQRIKILKNFTSLFNSNEILAPIPALQLNLGSE